MTATKRLMDAVRIPPIKDRDEATAIAAATATLTLAQQKAAILRDERIEALKMDFDLQIEEFAREIDKNTKRLSNWAVKNRSAEFGDKKTLYLAGHKLCFREGTGKVEFNAGVKEEEALNTILGSDDDAIIGRFTTIKTSLNKNAAISAWRASETLRDFLTTCGITVVKEEKFSFEPDTDSLPEAATIVVGKSAA